MMHVVFRWCTNQRSPSPKGKKSIRNHPDNQSSNRYCNIYFNNPLKLKQAYYGSRGKKGVIDVMNFLCAQLYLLLDDIKATLEASSVNERRWSSTRYCPTWRQPYGQSRVLMRLFFLPILSNQQHMWPNHKVHSTVLQIMYLVLCKFHRWVPTPHDRPPTYQGLVRPNLWGRWTGDHPGEDERS